VLKRRPTEGAREGEPVRRSKPEGIACLRVALATRRPEGMERV